MDNGLNDVKIEISELLFVILKKWRKVIVIAVVFGVLLAGARMVTEIKHRNDSIYIQNLKEQYEADLAKYEQEKSGYERDIKNLTVSIDYQEKYKENSILLQLDPYNKCTASVDVFIKMSELNQSNSNIFTPVDYADSVIRAYVSSIQNGEELAQLAKQKEIDIVYLKELVQVNADYDSNMFNVTVSYSDLAGAKQIINEIIDGISLMQLSVQQNLGEHTLVVMNKNVGMLADQTIMEYQKKKVEDLNLTNKALNDAENALVKIKKPELPVALSNRSIIKESIKNGIMGSIMGALLSCFIICLGFLFNGKLNIDNELKDRYGLKLLGSFPEKNEKKVFSAFDLWINKLQAKSINADELIYAIIAVKISKYIFKEDSIYLTGCIEQNLLNKVANSLQLNLKNVKIACGSDLINNVTTFNSISEFNKIILIEKRNYSKINYIEKEIEELHNLNKVIVGYIVLD